MGTRASKLNKSRPRQKQTKTNTRDLHNAHTFEDGGRVDFERVVAILSKQLELRKRRRFQNVKQRSEPDKRGCGDPKEHPVHKRGVRLTYVLSWLSNLASSYPAVTTTRDIVEKVVRPATRSSGGCLWAQLPESERGDPHVAVSHAWDYSVAFLQDMLKAARHDGHAPLAGCEFVWLDIFALTQHADSSGHQREEIAQLGSVFGASVPFVIQVTPSKERAMDRLRVTMERLKQQNRSARFNEIAAVDDAIMDEIPLGCFDRAWCVYELACAASSGAQFDVACPDANLDYFGPLTTLRAWAPQQARALHEGDRQSIRGLVLEAFGTWNTLKTVVTMIQLKANNVGPVTRFDPRLFRMQCSWQAAFPTKEDLEDHWDKFMDVYEKFYSDRLRQLETSQEGADNSLENSE